MVAAGHPLLGSGPQRVRAGMKRKTQQLLNKAREAVEAAEILLEAGKNDFAAGRAYYAMFYVAEALLFEKGLEFRKHGGVHAEFGEHFVKAGELDAKFHRYLLEAFEARLEADYGVDIVLSKEAVTTLIDRAKEFLKDASDYLETADGKT